LVLLGVVPVVALAVTFDAFFRFGRRLTPVITFDHVNKAFDNCQGDRRPFATITQGELLVGIGPSGSGKSSALKMINRSNTTAAHPVASQEIRNPSQRTFAAHGLRHRSIGLFPAGR
jgi:ABC-type proline/glycine betaine transport system ATPase subunit